MKTRIELTDSPIQMLMKMAGGNPGALNVLMQLFEKDAAIDPDSAFGPIGSILSLDTHGIYEHRIWMLYKDVCKEDLVNVVAVLRAVQLGKVSESSMQHAIDNYGEGLNVPECLSMVQAQLPKFGGGVVPQSKAEESQSLHTTEHTSGASLG